MPENGSRPPIGRRVLRMVHAGRASLARLMVRIFQRATSDRAGVRQFFAEAGRLMQQVSQPGSLERDLHLVHTLKGNCRQMGLESVAELCHEAETAMQDEQRPLDATARARLAARWEHLLGLASFAWDDHRPQVEVGEADLARLIEALRARAPHHELAALVGFALRLGEIIGSHRALGGLEMALGFLAVERVAEQLLGVGIAGIFLDRRLRVRRDDEAFGRPLLGGRDRNVIGRCDLFVPGKVLREEAQSRRGLREPFADVVRNHGSKPRSHEGTDKFL